MDPGLRRPSSEAQPGALSQGASVAPHDRRSLLALAITALVGMMIGFGIWSLAESGATGTSAAPTTRSVPVNAKQTTPAREPHIEVLKE